jgi:hypothetical protein
VKVRPDLPAGAGSKVTKIYMEKKKSHCFPKHLNTGSDLPAGAVKIDVSLGGKSSEMFRLDGGPAGARPLVMLPKRRWLERADVAGVGFAICAIGAPSPEMRAGQAPTGLALRALRNSARHGWRLSERQAAANAEQHL